MVLSRNATIDTMTATTMTRLVGATSRHFGSGTARRPGATRPAEGCIAIMAVSRGLAARRSCLLLLKPSGQPFPR